MTSGSNITVHTPTVHVNIIHGQEIEVELVATRDHLLSHTIKETQTAVCLGIISAM